MESQPPPSEQPLEPVEPRPVTPVAARQPSPPEPSQSSSGADPIAAERASPHAPGERVEVPSVAAAAVLEEPAVVWPEPALEGGPGTRASESAPPEPASPDSMPPESIPPGSITLEASPVEPSLVESSAADSMAPEPSVSDRGPGEEALGSTAAAAVPDLPGAASRLDASGRAPSAGAPPQALPSADAEAPEAPEESVSSPLTFEPADEQPAPAQESWFGPSTQTGSPARAAPEPEGAEPLAAAPAPGRAVPAQPVDASSGRGLEARDPSGPAFADSTPPEPVRPRAESKRPSTPPSRAGSPRASARPGAAEPIVAVEQLGKWYGKLQAVRDLSFRVRRGEVVGFLGPNGAGKSTTLRMLVGFLGPTEGRVVVCGHDVVESPMEARRNTGYMPEAAPLPPEMRVGEYLTFRARLKGVARKSIRSHVDDCLEKAGVGDVRRRLIGTLSRGYRQRVALAQALVGSPPLLILDEPTAGLDPNQIRSVRRLIRRLAKDHTVILSTHILSEVETTCNRAIVLHEGRLVAQGPISDLTRRVGPSRQLQLVLYDPLARGRELLASHPSVLIVQPHFSGEDPDVVEVRVDLRPTLQPAEAILQAMVTSLVEASVGIRAATVRTTGLEEVFERLTRTGGA